MSSIFVFRYFDSHNFCIGCSKGNGDEALQELNGKSSIPIQRYAVIETEFPRVGEAFLHRTLSDSQRSEPSGSTYFHALPSLMDHAIAAVRVYLEEYQKNIELTSQFAKIEPLEEKITPSEELKADYYRLIEIRRLLDQLKLEKGALELKIKVAIGPGTELDGIATWKAMISHRFDTKLFKETQPDLYQRYLKTKRTRVLRLVKSVG